MGSYRDDMECAGRCDGFSPTESRDDRSERHMSHEEVWVTMGEGGHDLPRVYARECDVPIDDDSISVFGRVRVHGGLAERDDRSERLQAEINAMVAKVLEVAAEMRATRAADFMTKQRLLAWADRLEKAIEDNNCSGPFVRHRETPAQEELRVEQNRAREVAAELRFLADVADEGNGKILLTSAILRRIAGGQK